MHLSSIIIFFCASLAFWRLPCYSRLGVFRIDPIVSKGKPSSHAHTLHGGQNLSFSSTYDDLLSSSCTSCAVREDMSAYWTPSLMFEHVNGTTEIVPQVGGMLIYYFLFGDRITAFPKGFEMIAGDASRRSYSIPIPDPPLSLWGPADKTQSALSQKAVGFNCLNYDRPAEGALTRHFLPNQSFIDSNCAHGLRLELMFPSCWDGSNLHASYNKSHIAYPDLLREGNCPKTFESRIPALYFETTWNTSVFYNDTGRFLLSNGDDTGFSYHGDFQNGWNMGILQQAVHECTNLSGLIEDCAVFSIQSRSEASKCTMATPVALANDCCMGPRMGLCGNVTV